MKKIYLFIATLGIATSLFAQSGVNNNVDAVNKAILKTSIPAAKGQVLEAWKPNNTPTAFQSQNGAAKVTLFTSNFTTAADWSIEGNGIATWVIATVTPFSTVVRPAGGAGNWAVINSDAAGNGAYDRTLRTTNSFSTLGSGAVQIKFRQRYTKFQDETKIVVSTDGTTWNEVAIAQNDAVAVNGALNTTSGSTASSFVTVNISQFAGNQATVWVGFKITGDYDYWWGIDDVTVESMPPSNELTMRSFYNLEYTKVPYDFAITPDFTIDYANVGGSDQTNVNVVTKLNTSLYTQTENFPVFSAGASGTATYTPTQAQIPVLGLGTYTASASITASETELTPANNSISNTFEITTSEYSRDNDFVDAADLMPYATTRTHLASSFFVYGDVNINSVEFVVGPGSSAGSVAKVQVYQITNPSTWDNDMAGLTAIGSPTTYTITAGDIAAAGANPTSIVVPVTGATLSSPTGAFLLVSVEKISGTYTIPYSYSNSHPAGSGFYSDIAGYHYDPTFEFPAGTPLPIWRRFTDNPHYFIRLNTQSSCVELTGQNTSSTPANCAALDGSVNVTNPTTGFGPYEFVWYTNPMSTNANTTGLAAGTYDLLMLDVSTLTNSGCPTQATATVAFNNTPVTYTKTVTQPTCLLPNGIIDITGATGTAPFNYSWTPSSVGTTSSITGLAPGSYTLNITDANGCFATADQSVLVNAGVPSTFTLSQTATSNCTTADGTATVATVNGPALSSYMWSPGSGTDVTATGLTGGTNYTLTAVNADNCTSTKSIIVVAGGAPTASTTVVSTVSCSGGNNGAFNISLAPATVGYTYSINGGAFAAATSITGLTAGTYTVNGTDGSCNVTTSAVIIQPATAMTGGASTITNVDCNGNSTGSIVISGVTGGTGAYKYSWTGTTTGGPQASATIPSLAAGTYNIVVQDANNCTLTPAIAAAVVTQPSAAISGTVVTQTDMTSPYSVTINITGGTAPYTVAGAGITPSLTGVTAGNKVISIAAAGAGSTDLTITDAKNCTYTLVMAPVGVKEVNSVNNLSVFPNPTENNVTISFNSTEAKNVTVKLVSLNGQEIFTQELPQFVGEYSKTVNLSTQAQGVYFLQIVSDKNVTTKKVVKL